MLQQVCAQFCCQLLLLDEEGVGQALLGLSQPIQQRLQLRGGDIVRHIQLRSCKHDTCKADRSANQSAPPSGCVLTSRNGGGGGAAAGGLVQHLACGIAFRGLKLDDHIRGLRLEASIRRSSRLVQPWVLCRPLVSHSRRGWLPEMRTAKHDPTLRKRAWVSRKLVASYALCMHAAILISFRQYASEPPNIHA